MYLSCTISDILSIISQNLKKSRDRDHAPFRDSLSCVGWDLLWSTAHQIWSHYVHSLRRYRRQRKCYGVVWGVSGQPLSLAMSPFDRAHTTSYSTLIETVRYILYRFRVIGICQKSPILTYPSALSAHVDGDPIRISPRPLTSEN